MTAAVAATLMSGGANASTVFDEKFVESDGFRGTSSGDIMDLNIGSLGNGTTTGLAGRIVNQQDVWSFSTKAMFSVSFSNLMVDGNSGFDTTSIFGATNGVRDAAFSLIDTSTSTVVDSFVFSAPVAAGTAIFSDIVAGSYELAIDGSIDFQQGVGATYDLGIATVPVPAALPLLGAGLGVLGLMRRRSRV